MSCRQQGVQSVELGYVIICKKWQVVGVVEEEEEEKEQEEW